MIEYRIQKTKGDRIEWANVLTYRDLSAAEVGLEDCEDRQIELREQAKIEDEIPFEEKRTNETSYRYRREWEGWSFRIVRREVTAWEVVGD